MYKFRIIKMQDGGYKFELGAIKLIVDGFTTINGKHILKNPNKALAFFNIGNDLYSISNVALNYNSAEELFDVIAEQYNIFNQNIHPDQNLKISA